MYIGADPLGAGLQISVATTESRPTRALLRDLWELRGGKRGINVAVVALHGDHATVFGPDPEARPIEDLSIGQAKRMLQAVLEEPNAIAAWDRFGAMQRQRTTTGVGGCINSGLFASHHLSRNVPDRPDWQSQTERAARLLHLRGRTLIEGLGFTIEEQGGALLLSGTSRPPRAVAVLLDDRETFDSRSAKHQLSPVAFGLREASDHDVDWLVALKDDRLRLYPGKTGIGVGQKGQTETYFEIDLATIDEGHAALLPLVFSADALEPDGSTQQILDGSAKYATDLGTRLRDRIYKDVVPPLAQAVAEHLPAMGLQVDEDGLRTAYRVTLRILFRLLFQAYAEDRRLLPTGRNEQYDAKSLKTAAQRDMHTDSSTFGSAATLWSDLEHVWAAIDQGNEQWMVPPYNGGLFARAKERSEEGAMIARLRLPDSALGPVLRALLVDVNEDGIRGAVDFQSLSVREFGTIYEGLLESSLSLAESDLTLDTAGAWVPAGDADKVVVPAGAAYFHNSSGERKATGSYFTPKIVVDHLVERSIVPVLGRHLERIAALLAEGEQVEAGRAFFDFRVADLAMGSGHFLVAAIDRVEAMYRDFLTKHDVPRVREELLRIGETAKRTLGRDAVAAGQVDDISLLRRQVARRCIYGIDVNPLALELSQLALWIHTFVPGLPMSSFDHNLVCANSLTGIGTVEEALAALEPKRPAGQVSLVDGVVIDALAAAAPLLVEAANADEADKGGVEAGAALREAARQKLEPLRRVFDLAVAIRTGAAKAIMAVDLEGLASAASTPAVRDAADQLNPAHMPYLFPEVFQRTNPGFDVLVGNPPWEAPHLKEDRWWSPQVPGLLAVPAGDRQRRIDELKLARPDLAENFMNERRQHDALRHAILRSDYPGLGAGHVDLYQAFAWRNWRLLAPHGRAGIVLPRNAMLGAGLTRWRKEVLDSGRFANVTFLLNTASWVFDLPNGTRLTIALVVLDATQSQEVWTAGPFVSAGEFAHGASRLAPIDKRELLAWSENSAVPMLPSGTSSGVLRKMKTGPSFFSTELPWAFRASRGDLLKSGAVRSGESPREGDLAIYAGASFNLWNPDAGGVYGRAVEEQYRRDYLENLGRSARNKKSAHHSVSFSLGDLPIDKPRIALRWITRATDTRTVLAALIPPRVATSDSASVLHRRSGSTRDEALVLGIMSSRPFDWQLRRWVEQNLTFELLGLASVPLNLDGRYADRASDISGRLAAVDERYQEWADEVGVPVGSVKTPAEKQDLIDELDALVSLLYGLTADQVEHIYATFHRGWDYAPRLAAVLEHFHAWEVRA